MLTIYSDQLSGRLALQGLVNLDSGSPSNRRDRRLVSHSEEALFLSEQRRH